MFANDDEDGDFLSPTGGAKLASLFGLDQATSLGNESFQYTAPKQPRKISMNSGAPSQKPAPSPGSSVVLFATAVQAYRYVNGQYMKQGKLGAAVLGNHTDKEYKMLLYVNQQKQLTAARIHPAFIFTVQQSNYCTFYDDQRQNWSLMFESEKAATDFCKEVCLAKANCGAPLETVVTQDLVPGEGQGVENGDSLEVAYTGWLLQNHTIGQMFDSNLNKDKQLRLKLGAGKVIKGWEEGMLNMRKGGRRLMVIPPALAYGSQGVPGRVPADSTLVFEAEIRRVKFVKDSGSEKLGVVSRDSDIPSPAPSVENLGADLTQQVSSTALPSSRPGELPLRAKSSSLNEQVSNPDATKAKLISRMARMGQPMLPFLTGAAAATSSQAESSDSELEDPSVSRLKERPAASSPQPVCLPSAPPPSLQATALMPVSMAAANPQLGAPAAVHAFQPVGHMYPTQTVPYQGSSDVTSFLMTEARQHSTEIRLAVGKVADKVDQLSAKMEDLHKQGGLSLGLSNVSMETAMIMHNIQRIIQENECLKKEVFEKSSRIEEQNRKIGELINQNQRCMEHSNLLMEKRNDSLKSSSEQNQARILQAEQDKHALPQDLGRNQARLTDELACSTARVSELQLELTAQRQRSSDLQTSLSAALQEAQQQSTRAAVLEGQLQELKDTAEQVKAQHKVEKQKRKEAELRLSTMDDELQDLKSEKENLERTLAERKRKWQVERQRCDEELEEVRKVSQQEMDTLRSQLRKARTSTDQAAAEQLAQAQADVDREWQVKHEQALTAAREQHSRQVTEITEQRDTLQLKLSQLQDRFSALKQSREVEEQRLLQQLDQGEELQALRDKCSTLEQKAEFLRRQGDARVEQLERRMAEQQQQPQPDTVGEVKRVMNGVFHSLRGEFDLQETYTGSAVLGVLINTIKSVTLQLLSKAEPLSAKGSEKEEDEDEEEDEPNRGPQPEQENPEQEIQVNGREKREEDEGDQAQEERSDVSETSEKRNGDGENQEREGEEEVIGGKEEVDERVTAKAREETHHHALPTDSKNREESVPSDTQAQAQSEDVAPEEETSGLSPPKGEVQSEAQSALGPLGELDVTKTKPNGPPQNPPPPPCPTQEDAMVTAPQTTSASEKGQGDDLGESFFQSPAPRKRPPPPTEEEEEELSLKGRPPPTPLFGDDSDEDDLDWLG